MAHSTVALFDDIVVARQVVADLVNADFARSSISLISNDAHITTPPRMMNESNWRVCINRSADGSPE